MKTFYKIENSRAQVGSGTFVPPEFTEYQVGQEPEELILALKVDEEIARVQAIKAKSGELITSKYPDYKQLNIIRVGGAELAEMTVYIDGIRTISNEAEKSGIKVEDIKWQ